MHHPCLIIIIFCVQGGCYEWDNKANNGPNQYYVYLLYLHSSFYMFLEVKHKDQKIGFNIYVLTMMFHQNKVENENRIL